VAALFGPPSYVSTLLSNSNVSIYLTHA
jgi:hypothetical protein